MSVYGNTPLSTAGRLVVSPWTHGRTNTHQLPLFWRRISQIWAHHYHARKMSNRIWSPLKPIQQGLVLRLLIFLEVCCHVFGPPVMGRIWVNLRMAYWVYWVRILR